MDIVHQHLHGGFLVAFFFFQAEDGIRDLIVTGVQTCALPIFKIPGAADTTWFRPAADRAAVRTRLGLPAERPLLLTVRNLERRMGLDLLIRAMAILKRDRPEALLLIGGGGSVRQELGSFRDALGPREPVRS